MELDYISMIFFNVLLLYFPSSDLFEFGIIMKIANLSNSCGRAPVMIKDYIRNMINIALCVTHLFPSENACDRRLLSSGPLPRINVYLITIESV